VLYAHVLYEQDVGQNSPPLPPTPAGEKVPKFSYGSKTTKVANVPPADILPSSSSQDFTPRLPPRPNNSIHPSSRIYPSSPSTSRAPPEKALPMVNTNLEDFSLSMQEDLHLEAGDAGSSAEINSIYFPVPSSPATSPTHSLEQPPNDTAGELPEIPSTVDNAL